MIRSFIALALVAGAAFSCAPAAAQSITGCGTVAIAKADAKSAARLQAGADCFGKAAAAANAARQARLDAIAALEPAPVPTPTPTPAPAAWTRCADEGGSCSAAGTASVRYGVDGAWSAARTVAGSIACSNDVFGDPAPGQVKACWMGPVTPAAPIRPSPTTKAAIGVNAAGIVYWSQERTLANVATGDNWRSPADWSDVPAEQLTPDGYPLAIADGAAPASMMLTVPETVFAGRDTAMRCTWQGTGRLVPIVNVRDVVEGDHSVRWTWLGAKKPQWDEAQSRVQILSSTPGDPLHALDCREPDMPSTAVYAPAIVAALKPFSVIRFLDQSLANANPASFTWAGRSTPAMVYSSARGTPLEHMVGLANAAGAAPWLTIPYNADEDYHRRAAQLVHDAVPADRQVYVELGNEPWNFAFPLATQLKNEAAAMGVAGDQWEGTYRRYAEKAAWAMDIWASVFADRPGQLVRVLNSQASNPYVGELMLGWKGVAAHVDALAIAPYFGGGLFEQNPGLVDQDKAMAWLAGDAQLLMTKYVPDNLAIARKHGVRLIAYEAGQHVLNPPGGVAQLAAINRDPRMGEIYAAYLKGWASVNPDLISLYASTGAISQYGAWGLREFGGQPLEQTPKSMAVLDAAAGLR